MNKIIQHIWTQIRAENTEKLTAVFDKERPIRSTGDMRTWYTSKPCESIDKSHISHCVYDSGWEASESYFLEKSNLVKSFVKNDHLGFFILYNFNGVIRKYYPDFLIRLSNNEYLILETKGVDSQQNQTKRDFLNEWVKAVNIQGGFGKWSWAVSFNPNDIGVILENSVKTYKGHVYVGSDNFKLAENIFFALKEFLEVSGIEISDEGKISQGSWIKEHIFYKIRDVFRSQEAKEIFDKTKKALELQQIEKYQSEVNKNNVEAAAILLNAVKDVPFFSTKMGSLVIIKATNQDGETQVITRLLTTEETIFYDQNPNLLNNPIELLNNLSENKQKKLN
jgi:type III restriction enzyme